jgi:hypothetical protein
MRTFPLIGALLVLSSALVHCGGDDATSSSASGATAAPASGARSTKADGGMNEDMRGRPMMKMMDDDMNRK